MRSVAGFLSLFVFLDFFFFPCWFACYGLFGLTGWAWPSGIL